MIFSLSTSLFAQEWVAPDAQTKGTGNSGTALADGPNASYWNPANLGKGVNMFFKFGMPEIFLNGFADIGVEGNVLKIFDRITDLYKNNSFSTLQTKLNNGTATSADFNPIFDALDNIAKLDNPGNGAVAFLGGSAEIKLGNMVFSLRDTVFGGIDPVVDLTLGGNAALANQGISKALQTVGTGQTPSTSTGQSLSTQLQTIPGVTAAQANQLAKMAEDALGSNLSSPETQTVINTVVNVTQQAATAGAGTGSTFVNNKSGVDVKGLELRELGFSTGFEMPALMESLRVGATLRILEGTTFKKSFIFNGTDDSDEVFEDVIKDFDENTKTSTGATVDIGANYPLLGEIITVSLVGKNLIPNSFDFEDGDGSFDINPMTRGGVLISPLGNLIKITADLDLTKNKFDGLDGYESRILGGGVQIDPSIPFLNLKVRGGLFTNIEAEDPSVIYTLGLHIGLFGFLALDAAGQVSSDTVDIESQSASSGENDVPNRVGGAVTLSLNFSW